MASALFVFDHKYPIDKLGNHYYSSGFDHEFFKRYFNIFERFDIFGRYVYVDDTSKLTKIKYKSRFYLVESNKKLFFSKTLKLLENAIDSVDCVIARMPSLFGTMAIRMAKKKNKPYMVEIVACTYDALINSSSVSRRTLAKPAEFFYKRALRDNPYNVYVTKEFLQKKYPCSGSQIACSNVTLPTVLEKVLVKRLDKIQKYNKKNRIIIGTTSTLNVDFKGQKYVIMALPELIQKGYDIEYQLVGDGDASWLMDIAREYGVENNVKIVGRLNHDDVFLWLDVLDIYVHASCQEGLSRAIIEAMSRGCPIVATDAGGVHELIDSKYIVPIKSATSIANGINEILQGNLENQAITNFEHSKEYLVSTLYKKREDYYKLFLEESGLK